MEIYTKEKALARYNEWRATAGDPEIARELAEIEGDGEAVYDRFFSELEFGTGGLRGKLGAGIRRMNVYTVARATRGLAAYLHESGLPLSCAIAYDSRINSRLFAETAAQVLAGAGVRVLLYPRLMPTPALSYAVRALGCGAGIVITASHNPAVYNGYKVYGADGCQITLEAAERITSFIAVAPYFAPVGESGCEVELIGEETITAFIEGARAAVPPSGEDCGLKLVYTPLCGAGGECVTRALAANGFGEVITVPGQDKPDGNFPGCPFPNPELPEALAEGLALCREVGAELLVATDPDCDRAGIAVLDGGEYRLLTGNETGVVLLSYLLERRRALGTLPARPVIIKTIVTTDMAADMAREAGAELREVLTGFKFIGEQIGGLEASGEAEHFVFGFEESYGYLCSPYVRDKDAVSAALLICEAARYYKARGLTLCGVLDALRSKYGCHRALLHSLTLEGSDGIERMQAIMRSLRAAAPATLAGRALESRSDYLTGETITSGGGCSPVGLPKSDVLKLRYEGNLTLTIRPSGTEPKLKLYLAAAEPSIPVSDALIALALSEALDAIH